MRVNVGARGRSQTANSDPVTISTGCSLTVHFATCPSGQFTIAFRSSMGFTDEEIPANSSAAAAAQKNVRCSRSIASRAPAAQSVLFGGSEADIGPNETRKLLWVL
jgi:hypothetical protein